MPEFRTPFNAIEDPPGFDPPIYPQAQWDPVDALIIDQATAGEGVLSGCEVTESTPLGLSVDVAVGQVVIDGVVWDVDPTNDLAIATPNLTQPRFDLVCAEEATTPFIVTGSPAAFSPLFPLGGAVPGDSVVLAAIYVPAGLTAVTDDHITDKAGHVHLPPAGQTDWQPVGATSDLPRNNTAALAADSVLKVALSANVKYRIRGVVAFSTLAASDAKFGFLGPASPTFLAITSRWVSSGNATISSRTVAVYDTTGVIISSTANLSAFVEFEAIVHNGSNSGDFSFAWGQNVAVAENTVRRAGSRLEWAVT